MLADSGNGGSVLIDPAAADTTNVTLYHTYSNQTGALVALARVKSKAGATPGGWTVFGAGSLAVPGGPGVGKPTSDGLGLTNAVNGYAPLALGPGKPAPLYFGTERLYRSADGGTTMKVVSQGPWPGTTWATPSRSVVLRSPLSTIGCGW